MLFCTNCGKKAINPDNLDGKICCPYCGRVIDEDNFSHEPTFVKNASGQSQLSGNFVKAKRNTQVSERTLNEAYDGINNMMYALGVDGGDFIANAALSLYEHAVERNFTRGRRKELVQASCLYVICRVNRKPYLLIDFSEYLGINVYVLGAVFLQVCKQLNLVEHDFCQNLADPSLYIHRFADRLFRAQRKIVSTTALLIVASMKRDWMQTGRKPSGLCGAALYISALSHGLKCSKSDVIRAVHVCEATLTKRLIEFENTESGGLTIEEFNTKADEFAKEEKLLALKKGGSMISELLCKHKGSGEPPFAHGLCKSCYEDFIKLSGGLDRGLEPPAFQRAEKERMATEAAMDSSENLDPSTFSDLEHNNEQLNYDEQRSTKDVSVKKNTQPTECDSTGANLHNKTIDDSVDDGVHADGPLEDSETLSDIDDNEVDIYLHTEEEKQYKKIIWEELNKEYLEEQAEKEAVAKAAREAFEAKFANCSDDVKAAQELAAAAAAAVAKSKKERQQKRAAEAKNSGPPRSAAEATLGVLTKKKLSSKFNHDVVEDLFRDSPEPPESNKRSRTEAMVDGEDDHVGQEDPEFEDYGDSNDFADFHDDF